MCGIVGYIGTREATPMLLDGLKRLEYRGYDSAGIAVLTADQTIEILKTQGKLARLVDRVNGNAPRGVLGLGHTRWATHGAPNDVNAHPHADCTGRLAVVHNGIIENYAELRTALIARGHRFVSETDTEVIAHLVEEELEGRDLSSPNLIEATRRALNQVRGSYAIGLLHSAVPELLVAARHFSPLVIGIGDGENFMASDIPAFLPYTRRALLLEDGEVAALTREAIHVETLDGLPVERDRSR